MSSNMITAITPGAFDGLQKLRTLDLSNNGISSLPERVFDSNTRLRKLNLRNNLLKELQPHLFGKNGLLENIDISYNLLNATVFTTLNQSHLLQLKVINVSGNRLGTLGPNILKEKEVSSLRALVLRDTQLTHIDNQAFTGLGSLQLLDLSENLLSTLEAESFIPFESLYIRLVGNRLVCSCTLLDAIAALKRISIGVPEATFCTEVTKGKQWNIMELDQVLTSCSPSTTSCTENATLDILDMGVANTKPWAHVVNVLVIGVSSLPDVKCGLSLEVTRFIPHTISFRHRQQQVRLFHLTKGTEYNICCYEKVCDILRCLPFRPQ